MQTTWSKICESAGLALVAAFARGARRSALNPQTPSRAGLNLAHDLELTALCAGALAPNLKDSMRRAAEHCARNGQLDKQHRAEALLATLSDRD